MKSAAIGDSMVNETIEDHVIFTGGDNICRALSYYYIVVLMSDDPELNLIKVSTEPNKPFHIGKIFLF
jgi:hypothetical protein